MVIINIYLYKRKAGQLLRHGDLPTSDQKKSGSARSLGGARESSPSVGAARRIIRYGIFFVAQIKNVRIMLWGVASPILPTAGRMRLHVWLCSRLRDHLNSKLGFLPA